MQSPKVREKVNEKSKDIFIRGQEIVVNIKISNLFKFGKNFD